jgi:ubiquinone/menaquinone biosynthesis C-methylase UbiE
MVVKKENDDKSELIREHLHGWDLAGETEQSAMYYVNYRGIDKNWGREEFYEGGIKDVNECTSDFFKQMSFNPDGKRMLDIGCGIGRMTRAFAEIFGEAHGVDFSTNLIKVAREIHKDKPNLHFQVNNGIDLSVYDTDFFDFCFSYVVMHHIANFKVIANYVREIDRVLKPEGLLMFQVNTSKWISKAFGLLPMHYRVRNLLYKIGLLDAYARMKIKDPVKASIVSRAERIYYTSPKKLDDVLKDTSLEITGITGLKTRYTFYYGKKRASS